MNKVLLKILDSFYIGILWLIITAIKTSIFILKKKKKNRIAALPYLPENYPGGNIRIGNWKKHFNNRNQEFDVFWASEKDQFEKWITPGLNIKNYFFHFLVLFKRTKTFLKIRNYEIIWLQRNFIPFYPLKDPLFEKLIKKLGKVLIVDYYDADYLHNKSLVNETALIADKITVSSPFLFEYFKKINPYTFLLPLTIEPNKYYQKDGNQKNKELVIGWMGNPGNALELIKIKEALIALEKRYSKKISFEFLCRGEISLPLKQLKLKKWTEKDFNYYDWLSSVDIGIVPYTSNTERLRAKSPMKTLEFLCSSIPVVISPCESYPELIHNDNCLIARDYEEWINYISMLIENPNERKRIGKSGKFYFNNHHTYTKNINLLQKILSLNSI